MNSVHHLTIPGGQAMRYELRAPTAMVTAGVESVIDGRVRRALGRFRDWIRGDRRRITEQ